MFYRAESLGGFRARLVFFLAFLYPLCLSSDPAYDLSYDWSLGRHFEYSIYIIGQITTGQEGRQDIRAKFTDVWEVVEEDRAKNLSRVVEKGEDYSGTSFDIRSYGLPLPGPPVERLIDRHGRVAMVIGYPEDHRLYLLALVMPQVPVAEDGKWSLSHEIQYPLFEREVTASITVVYTFEEVAKNYKGTRRNCARIRVDANYQYQAPDGSAGVSGAFQGKVFFDLTEKKIVDYQFTANRREFLKPDNRVRTSSLQITCIANSVGSPGLPSGGASP